MYIPQKMSGEVDELKKVCTVGGVLVLPILHLINIMLFLVHTYVPYKFSNEVQLGSFILIAALSAGLVVCWLYLFYGHSNSKLTLQNGGFLSLLILSAVSAIGYCSSVV